MLINVDQWLLRLSWSEDEELQVPYSDIVLVCYPLMGLIGLSDSGQHLIVDQPHKPVAVCLYPVVSTLEKS